MQSFDRLTAVAAPLMRNDIDTDQIIPVPRMLSSMTPDLAAGLFANMRYISGDEPDPGFVLNRPEFSGAQILVTGDNFGCGSSREQAVWALLEFGIRCVIAQSFGDIFFDNCFRKGLLPVQLPVAELRMVVEDIAAHPGRPLTVDLIDSCITLPSGTLVPFTIDGGLRQNLLEGLDDIGKTMKHERAIAAFQETDRQNRSWVYDCAPRRN